MKYLCHLLALGLAFGATACSSEDESTPAAKELKAVSYNLGLAVGFVPAAAERAPLTTDAVAALDANVLCLQEVWNSEHVDMMKSAAGASFPHTAFMAPDAGTVGAATCTQADLDPLKTCVTTNGCDKVCGDDMVTCALTKCGAELSALPPDCYGCVQANVGKSVDDILAACIGESAEYAYGGSFGIGLLSAYPLEAQDSLVLDSTTNRRAVLYARLDTELGPVHAFCTHLTAVFDTIAYPKPTGSWQEEQAKQIDDLLAFVASKAGSDGGVLIMGDMNAGPAGDGYVAEVQANYDKLMAGGLSDPYVDTPGALCTFCGDNPLVGGGDSVLIDHILTSNLGSSATGKRVMDDPITVPVCGTDKEVRYSDHYGIRVTINE